MADKACHMAVAALQVGLIQALGSLCNRFVLFSFPAATTQASAASRAKQVFG
jgi:hypothetical protein